MARRKYKFVEEFVDPVTNQSPGGSPAWVDGGPLLGKFYGHQIAKIEYHVKKARQKTWVTDRNGNSVEGPEKESEVVTETMGTRGGWVEYIGNLSQFGDCWIGQQACACGKSHVMGNAQIREEAGVGGNAVVGDDAEVKGKAVVTGRALVMGEAKIDGEERIAADGEATVLGEMSDKSTIRGHAMLLADGVMKGSSCAEGHAMVYGMLEDKAYAAGNAVVKGKVSDEAVVEGDAVLFESAEVKDQAVVRGAAVVLGKVINTGALLNGQTFVGSGGIVRNQGTLMDNASTDGTVRDKASVRGNGVVRSGGTMSDQGRCSDNAVVSGTSRAACGGTSLTKGVVARGGISDGAVLWEDGILQKGSVGGSCSISGAINGGVCSGNAVVAKGANLENIILEGNAKVGPGVSSKSPASGNAAVMSSDAKAASGNAVIVGKGADGAGNEVVMEKGNAEPEGISVVCEVSA